MTILTQCRFKKQCTYYIYVTFQTRYNLTYTITLNINIPITCNKYKRKPISTNNRSIFSKSIYVYVRVSIYYVQHIIKSFNLTKLIEFCAIRHHRYIYVYLKKYIFPYTEMFLATDSISIRLCSYIFHKN